MAKTIKEINEKIRRGKAVTVTAEEIISIVRKKGTAKAAREVDVVTTGTFGPMCSSGAFLNLGHSSPRIKLGGGKVLLNNVPAYNGLAAVDTYIGATAIPENDPRNFNYPGKFPYGGGHVIEDLAAGKKIKLTAEAYGTDCYPCRQRETWVTLADLPEAVLFNPRNAYQNYNVAVNLSSQTIYTYLGILGPNLANANYCSAGQLSPLLNDPCYLTTGVGTKIFLGGGTGYVAWHGTQHNPNVKRGENEVPRLPAGTLSLIGDLREMQPKWLKGASFLGYGTTLIVGVGIPIPVLNEKICRQVAVRDEDIFAPIVEYSHDYPQMTGKTLGEVSYARLKKGAISLLGKEVPTAPLSSYARAREIAETLKKWIEEKKFTLTEPVKGLPGNNK